jgi:hypothetical protein
MKNFLFTIISVAGVSMFSMSCNKTITETKLVTDTLVVHKQDTLVVNSKDTSIAMDIAAWDCYSHNTTSLVAPGASTYFNTEEGIKVIGQGVRRGTRLQTKKELGFKDKTIYYKWKGYGGGQFAAFVVQVKYDPLSYDATNPPLQGEDFGNFSVGGSFNNSFLIQEDTWYYTRIKAITGTDNYEVTTALGNYSNNGGTTVKTETVAIYTKSGYLAIRIGDNYAGSNSYVVLGECKVASN